MPLFKTAAVRPAEVQTLTDAGTAGGMRSLPKGSPAPAGPYGRDVSTVRRPGCGTTEKDVRTGLSVAAALAAMSSIAAKAPVGQRRASRVPAVARRAMTSDSEKADADTDPVELWQRCVRIGSSYFTDEASKGDAWSRLAGVVGLALAQTAFSVGFSFLQKDFWNSLNTKQADEFYHILALQLAAFTLATPIFALRDFYAGKLSNRWRKHLTEQLLGRFVGDKTYYALGLRQGAVVDNPDQRIVDDIYTFTDTAVSLFLSVFNALVDLISFSTVLVSIYTPLLYALGIYAVGGTFLAYFIGRSIIGYQNLQEQKEADFRYGLVRLRENAEAVAFYSNEEEETDFLRRRFVEAFENFELLLGRRRNLGMFQTGYRLLVQVLPIGVVSPMYFAGAIELGVVTQSYGAFNHVLSDLSLIVNRFEALSTFSTCTNRLAFLVDALEACAGQVGGERITRLALPNHQNGLVIKADGLSLRTPDAAKLLAEDLSFELREGEALLVTGPSGAGKTSLCRTVAGLPLWGVGSGELSVVPPAWRGGKDAERSQGHCQCLPQQPYMLPKGATMRAQLSYLCSEGHEPSYDEITSALRAVGLEALAPRLSDEGIDWARTLSPGEQQRVAFARLLLGPAVSLVVLDEATSALDEEAEQRCYAALRSRGPAILSVGHRAALRSVHDRELRLLGAGRWELLDLAGVRAAPVPVPQLQRGLVTRA